MSHSLSWAEALLDELAHAGVRDVVVSPGSRSAPLALAALDDDRLRDHSVLDERSAGFLALGLALTTRRPVSLVCTSGTAAANYLPAVIEASLSRVPLILLTADRPHELRDCGAPQTIDQLGLYGGHVRWFQDLPTPGPEAALWSHLRRCAARAAAEAMGAPWGPVHLNVPLREPLAPTADALPEPGGPRPDGLTRTTRADRVPDEDTIERVTEFLASEAKGWLLVGPLHANAEESAAIARLSRAAAWPVLGEPLSQQRAGAETAGHYVDAHDPLLRARGFVERWAPTRVLRLGAPPTSKALNQWLAGSAATQWLVDPDGWRDPDARIQHLHRCDPLPLLERCSERLEANPPRTESSFAASWTRAGQRTREILNRELDRHAEISEPEVIRAAAEIVPAGAAVYLANSMPVRDADAFWPSSPRKLRFFGNRGANGIDGSLSTLAGIASGTEGPTLGLLGDLALLHDSSGLLAVRELDANLTVLVIDNGGGGIFEFLPIAKSIDRSSFERHFGTDQGVDLPAVLRGFDLPCAVPQSPLELRAQLKEAVHDPGTQFLVVRTRRETNAAWHAELFRSVASELDS